MAGNLDRRRHIETWQIAVPKGEYCQLASRQHKLVDDAADNYNLPIGEATINLRDALTALHDLVAATHIEFLEVTWMAIVTSWREKSCVSRFLGLEYDNAKKQNRAAIHRGDAIQRQRYATRWSH